MRRAIRRKYLLTITDTEVHVIWKTKETIGQERHEKMDPRSLEEISPALDNDTEIYALDEKRPQPYPSNSNQKKRIQTQLVGTWENRLREEIGLYDNPWTDIESSTIYFTAIDKPPNQTEAPPKHTINEYLEEFIQDKNLDELQKE
ncbi:17831_t:CDS:2 [Gigaspora margarita]|uniref:17831_t:CDS:1 n=1 Tax=Gigaspora margarita TaxID=4874 RepID=A0ABM8W296_GIGMA|nr:17831_t:CDS:2 [Gigaspora margarita]